MHSDIDTHDADTAIINDVVSEFLFGGKSAYRGNAHHLGDGGYRIIYNDCDGYADPNNYDDM